MTGQKLSDVERRQAAGMVIGGVSYRQTAERFNVSHSVIVRLKQRVNQTGNVNKGNNKITELRTILQRESQNS
jgi:transposase